MQIRSLIPPRFQLLLTHPLLQQLPQLRLIRHLLTFKHAFAELHKTKFPPFLCSQRHYFPSGLSFPTVTLKRNKVRLYADTQTRTPAPLLDAPPKARLSENLTAADLSAPGYRYARISLELVLVLERVIAWLRGHKLIFVSTYRPPALNRAQNGPKDSAHVDGLAADIRCDDVSLEHLYELACEAVGERGAVYLYPDRYVHLDVAGKFGRGADI